MNCGGRARIVALHGFLGSSSDWADLPEFFPGTQVVGVDLWAALSGLPRLDWAAATAAVDAVLAPTVTAADGCPTFVLGYSLGARLALGSRLLASADANVRGCVLVSCNPGLDDGDVATRQSRRESDEAWARRILANHEPDLWDAWDAQPVFAGSLRPMRRSGLPAPRRELARVLRACSLAGQPDLRPRLAAWPTPVLWVTGARDAKFQAIADALRPASGDAEFVTCDEAGHRAPWDNPAGFARLVCTFVARQLEGHA